MPRNIISSILNAVATTLGPQVTAPNTLNPVHLALGTRGYWIQSRILHIPDRYGFFSPAPPRLQVYQAFLFIVISIMIVWTAFLGAFVVFLVSSRPDHKPIWRVVVFMVAGVAGVTAVIWAMACFDKTRAPDYDWEDWKLKED